VVQDTLRQWGDYRDCRGASSYRNARCGDRSQDFVKILCVNGAITAIANGHLPTVITAMRAAGIDLKDFVKILCVNGAITAIANGHLPTVITAMRAAGIDDDDVFYLFLRISRISRTLSRFSASMGRLQRLPKVNSMRQSQRCARPQSLTISMDHDSGPSRSNRPSCKRELVEHHC
jgi:hypothetical protein